MAFGLFGLSNLIPGQRSVQNLQAPQASIGVNAPQIPGRARRAVATQAGNGNLGGTPDMAAPGSQSMDGLQMTAGRPRQMSSPASLPESTGTGFGQEMLRSVTPQLITPEQKTKLWEAYTPGGVSVSGFVPNTYIPASPDSARPLYDPESMMAINDAEDYRRNPTDLQNDMLVRRGKMNASLEAYNANSPRSRIANPIMISPSDVDLSPETNQLYNRLTTRDANPTQRGLPSADVAPFQNVLDDIDRHRAEREQRFRQLQGELPTAVNAEEIANQDVAKKGKLWRLGQLGLGALKGFAGLNQDGGSGLLGAISGAVSGGTGDLYRRKRVAGIEGEQAEALDLWDRKAKLYGQYADDETALDRVQNTAVMNLRKYQDDYAGLVEAYNKGQISLDRLNLEKQKLEDLNAREQAKLEEARLKRESVEKMGQRRIESNEKMTTERVEGANKRANTMAAAAAGRQSRGIEATRERDIWKRENAAPKERSQGEIEAETAKAMEGEIKNIINKEFGSRKDDEVYQTIKIPGSDEGFPITVAQAKARRKNDLLKKAKAAEDNIRKGKPVFEGIE